MTRTLLALVGALLVAAVVAAQEPRPEMPRPPAQAAPSSEVENGRRAYGRLACSYCHGTVGQGSAASIGPRIAGTPRTLDSFTRYVRRPAGRMSAYSEKVLPSTELGDIYAFLRSLPAARPVSAIPLLDEMHRR